MKPYPQVDESLGPVQRVQMPRAPRLHAPGSTVHLVARRNNGAFSFTTPEDFQVLLAHLREPVRTYEVTALVTPNPPATLHPNYPAWARTRLCARGTTARSWRPAPTLDARDPRWTAQRAVGTAAFVARYTPRRGRRTLVPVPPQIRTLGA